MLEHQRGCPTRSQWLVYKQQTDFLLTSRPTCRQWPGRMCIPTPGGRRKSSSSRSLRHGSAPFAIVKPQSPHRTTLAGTPVPQFQLLKEFVAVTRCFSHCVFERRNRCRSWEVNVLTASSVDSVCVAPYFAWADDGIDTGETSARVAIHAPEGVDGSRENGGGCRECDNRFHGENGSLLLVEMQREATSGSMRYALENEQCDSWYAGKLYVRDNVIRCRCNWKSTDQDWASRTILCDGQEGSVKCVQRKRMDSVQQAEQQIANGRFRLGQKNDRYRKGEGASVEKGADGGGIGARRMPQYQVRWCTPGAGGDEGMACLKEVKRCWTGGGELG